MKKIGFNEYVYDFSADYDAIDVDYIKDIHKYLMKKNDIVLIKIHRFVKKVFFTGLTILSNFTNAILLSAAPLSTTRSNATLLSCISMNNQPCKVRPEIINVNSNNPIFYPFNVRTSKCSGNCNNINDPFAKICVPDVVKDLNVKVFNLMSRTNETKI